MNDINVKLLKLNTGLNESLNECQESIDEVNKFLEGRVKDEE